MADETPLSIHHPESGAVGGVVVIQEVFGVTPHIEDVCQRLADAGWLAVAPHLFWRTGDPQLPDDDFSQVRPHVGAMTADTILADVDAALAYIEGAGYPREVAGIVGFCAGGTIALGVAANRQIGAAVTYYGGGILEGRFGFAPMIEMARDLTVPWLGLFGGQDQSIPPDQVDRLAEAAAEAEVPTEVIVYPDAGHAFNRDGSAAYHEASATDAWHRALGWFADHLTTGAAETE
ncbi:MAG TPA: dienelactone hydrolase family protein [Acidimicrobiales bacterium]|nr:dienelactone hydrolase family protein [Acidimicrobiales bacterium]